MKNPGKERLKPGPKPKSPEERRENVVVRFNTEERSLIDEAAGPAKGARSKFIRSAALARARRKLKAKK